MPHRPETPLLPLTRREALHLAAGTALTTLLLGWPRGTQVLGKE